MRKSNSDASKVRQVLDSYGYVAYNFYSESRKNHRRVKAWICKVNGVDLENIEKDLREVFGERFKSCYNMQAQSYSHSFVSFIVELAPFNE